MQTTIEELWAIPFSRLASTAAMTESYLALEAGSLNLLIPPFLPCGSDTALATSGPSGDILR